MSNFYISYYYSHHNRDSFSFVEQDLSLALSRLGTLRDIKNTCQGDVLGPGLV